MYVVYYLGEHSETKECASAEQSNHEILPEILAASPVVACIVEEKLQSSTTLINRL